MQRTLPHLSLEACFYPNHILVLTSCVPWVCVCVFLAARRQQMCFSGRRSLNTRHPSHCPSIRTSTREIQIGANVRRLDSGRQTNAVPNGRLIQARLQTYFQNARANIAACYYQTACTAYCTYISSKQLHVEARVQVQLCGVNRYPSRNDFGSTIDHSICQFYVTAA